MNSGDLVLVDTLPLNPATLWGATQPPAWAKPGQDSWWLVTFCTGCMRTPSAL
jgi:hypothetical protein